MLNNPGSFYFSCWVQVIADKTAGSDLGGNQWPNHSHWKMAECFQSETDSSGTVSSNHPSPSLGQKALQGQLSGGSGAASKPFTFQKRSSGMKSTFDSYIRFWSQLFGLWSFLDLKFILCKRLPDLPFLLWKSNKNLDLVWIAKLFITEKIYEVINAI